MTSCRTSASVAVVCFFALLSPCARADFSTPFLETAKEVGQVLEGRGYLLVEETEKETTYFIMVMSDTVQFLMIPAAAEPGVIPSSALGRSLNIRAQVVSMPLSRTATMGSGMRLKILSVTPPTTRPAK